MTLSAEVTRHHTAWVHCADCPPHPVRYAVDGDRLVCFGDQLPANATNGRQVFVTVHEIAGGPALAELTGTIHDVAADDLDPNAILDLLEHVSLGRTAAEVDTAIIRHRQRRIVALEPQGGPVS
ncbi:MAG TPA: hypothetical protein VIJ48_04455 [Acidimicrobiia bacterium]